MTFTKERTDNTALLFSPLGHILLLFMQKKTAPGWSKNNMYFSHPLSRAFGEMTLKVCK